MGAPLPSERGITIGQRTSFDQGSLSPEEFEREARRQLIQTRLGGVYDFARTYMLSLNEGRKLGSILDVGAYEGTFGEKLDGIAEHIITFDIDKANLWDASLYYQQLKAEGKITATVNLLEMDACAINLEESSVNGGLIIEVLGAGFQTAEGIEGVRKLFTGVWKTLKKDAPLVFTVRSKSMMLLNSLIAGSFADLKGYPVYRRDLKPILSPLFYDIQWHGQMITVNDPGAGTFLPGIYRDTDENGKSKVVWDPKIFIPHKIKDETIHYPFYWVCQARAMKE